MHLARLRLAATVSALVVLPLVLSARVLRRELRVMSDAVPSVIDQQVARYRELVSALPTAGPLGYLSDGPLFAGREQYGIAFNDYEIARYALRPRQLRPKPEGEWVVGQFEAPSLIESTAAKHGLVIHRDFGDGLLLLRR